MNVFYFEGDPMIRAENVQDMSSEVTVIRKGADEVLTSSGLRDILRKVACGMQFIVMGVEEQSEVHYAMPVRVMEYDTAEYGRQIREKKKTAQRAERFARTRIFYLVFRGRTGCCQP